MTTPEPPNSRRPKKPEPRSSQIFTVDEVINRVMAKARSRTGRVAATVLALAVVSAIVVIPLTRSAGAPTPAAKPTPFVDPQIPSLTTGENHAAHAPPRPVHATRHRPTHEHHHLVDDDVHEHVDHHLDDDDNDDHHAAPAAAADADDAPADRTARHGHRGPDRLIGVPPGD